MTGSPLDAPDEPRDAAPGARWPEETGITQGELRDWQYHRERLDVSPSTAGATHGVTHNTEHVFGLTLPARVPVTLNREHLDHLWLPWQDAAARCFFHPATVEAILRLPGYTMTG